LVIEEIAAPRRVTAMRELIAATTLSSGCSGRMVLPCIIISKTIKTNKLKNRAFPIFLY